MKKQLRSRIITDAKRNKAQRHLARITRKECSRKQISYGDNIPDWYLRRKRANQRLKALSCGQMLIIENGYRGDSRPHWIKDLKCEHLFRMSLRALSLNRNQACPFCNGTSDLRCYGSIEALQQHVLDLSFSNAYFHSSNIMGSSSDEYLFHCQLHKIEYRTSIDNFIAKAGNTNGCPICLLEKVHES